MRGVTGVTRSLAQVCAVCSPATWGSERNRDFSPIDEEQAVVLVHPPHSWASKGSSWLLPIILQDTVELLHQVGELFWVFFLNDGLSEVPPCFLGTKGHAFTIRPVCCREAESVRITIASLSNPRGTMGNLSGALQQLRAERKQAQARVESIDQAILVIESLNGVGTLGQANQPTRIISQASRRKMAQAQRARWAKARKNSQPIAVTKTTASAPVKRTMSAAARRKIAAFQRARWAKVKAQRKKAA